MSTKKKVIVIEDNDRVRKPLAKLLRRAGFEVYEAANKTEGFELADHWWGDLDVAVLDMHLSEIPSEKVDDESTGAGIAIKLRQTKRSFPPEFLIFSNKNEINYYDLALRLGAARYLFKGKDNADDVVRHIRVLALRRALNGENPKTAAEVARIAVHSRSKPEAILEFCRGILKEEFESCLGAEFLILFTQDDTTQICAYHINFGEKQGSFELPDDHWLYHRLQALAHGEGNLSIPFVLESARLEDAGDDRLDQLKTKLDGAAFLPLSLSSDLKLSIGILRDQTEDASSPNDAEALCTVLSQYLRPTVLENILTIWSQWTELRATLSSTARLCLSVGQELAGNATNQDHLKSLAADLRETGQYLTQLGRKSQLNVEQMSITEILASEWQWIAPTDYPMELTVDGDCTVEMQRSDLQMILSRLMQWLAYRGKLTPLDVMAGISVSCETSNGMASIKFEDRSDRLDKKLRRELFAPFTQAVPVPAPFAEIVGRAGGRYLPLYLAKMLVEGRYHGTLSDQSDGITDRNYGHRILMQLPVSTRVG